jgi:DNA-damage-inducible protein J
MYAKNRELFIMAQASVNIRMDESLKRQLEQLCFSLGMSVTTAMTIFAKTAVREQGIPFAIKLPNNVHMKSVDEMTKAEFDTKIQKGMDAVAEGRVRPATDVFDDMERKYGQ